MSTPAKRHHVVIIGSGFGGLTAAQALKRADVDVTLISKTTSHLFQPLLYQVATGILSEGEIAPTTRLVLREQKNVQVLLGEVEGIDLEAKTVTAKLMTMPSASIIVDLPTPGTPVIPTCIALPASGISAINSC